MDVMRLTNANIAGRMDVSQSQVTGKGVPVKASTPPRVPPLQRSKEQVQIALDKLVRNTRFQYEIKDKLGYFVVRIIDNDTDKVIKEIPSKELQKVHSNIERALGLIFDKEI